MQNYKPSEGMGYTSGSPSGGAAVGAAAAAPTYNSSSPPTTTPRGGVGGAVVLGDLPPNVRDAAALRQHVIAWTQFDPALADRLCCQSCATAFGPLPFLPCFWPHMLILLPCLLVGKMNVENTIRSQYWILTERELTVVTIDHPTSCCTSSGNQVKTIPLENITDCGIDSVGKGCMNQCYDAMPNIHIDTARRLIAGGRRRRSVRPRILHSQDSRPARYRQIGRLRPQYGNYNISNGVGGVCTTTGHGNCYGRTNATRLCRWGRYYCVGHGSNETGPGIVRCGIDFRQ
jgi:hypothetical protein